MSGQYVMGIDNGGTVSKAAIFDLKGNEISVASRHSSVHTPRPGYTERDMEALWIMNCECIREAIAKSGINPENIAGVSVCGHGKGLYAWGKDDKPAYNGIISTDNRAWEYPQKWKETGIFSELYPQLCQQLIPCQQAAILAWFKDHDKETYDNIKWVFSVKDYIRFRLTGEAWCEATDISGSGLMDVKNICFDRDLLAKLGIEEVYDKLAPIRYSSDICGFITKSTAELTGLPQGLPVAGGMFDIDSCAVAMDVTSPEELCVITGTWSINEYIAKEPVLGTEIAMNSIFAMPEYYLIEECSATGAGNIEWYIENYLKNETVPSGKKLYQYMDEMVEKTDSKECDIYYLPFLYGSNVHALAKASFVGLTSFHNKWHVLRAMYEGIAFSHKYHIDKLLSARNAPKEIRLAGGAANSRIWVQIFADVLNYPISTVRGVKELGALGCSMSAAIGASIFKDYKEAARSMVRVNEAIIPDKDMSELYKKKYDKYLKIVSALEEIWSDFEV